MDIVVGSLPESAQHMAPCCQIFDAQRLAGDQAPDQTVLLDDCSPSQAKCFFLRLGGDLNPLSIKLVLEGPHSLDACDAGGWLLRPEQEGPTYWAPIQPRLRRLDRDGHILEESEAPLSGLDVSASGLAASFDIPEGWQLDCVIWRLENPSLATELNQLTPIETAGYFSLGSHTAYRKPADLYAHLIHGWVYENRFSWPNRWKICSENDAHALFMILSGLEKATDKRIYALLKRQLLLSVLLRQSEDGGFRHGEWSDRMESHYRLHASAMHLMIDALADGGEPRVRQALARAAEFIAGQTDRLTVGTWFLHDELEHNEESMRAAPFKWVESRALGKRASNMLVLNTQLDTSIALERYREQTGNSAYATTVASARAATQAVLTLRPAEALYKLLFRIINLTFLPTSHAQALPLWQRALKRIGWKYLIPRLPDIKARFPRLVMPDGYIDRELTLRTWAHHYLSINLMDLARYHRRFPDTELDQLLWQTAEYTHDSGILQRWAEMKYEKYALGFWAEALYHLCLLFPAEDRYRAWLAEAVLLLGDTRQGLPPSLLGANAEALPKASQRPCPATARTGLRVVNLRRDNLTELLVVNPTEQATLLSWVGTPPQEVRWQQAGSQSLLVPARGWLWGQPVVA